MNRTSRNVRNHEAQESACNISFVRGERGTEKNMRRSLVENFPNLMKKTISTSKKHNELQVP